MEQRFVRDVRRFRREEAKIKRDITQRRKDESDKEDRLLTQLKTLKIKIAQSTQAGQRR
jgi:hypothetical protein